jgi:hypothetical protein
MQYIRENMEIKYSVLKKLPQPCTFGPLVEVEDMDREKRDCMIIHWMEPGATFFSAARPLVRSGYFCIYTGEYVGEHIP